MVTLIHADFGPRSGADQMMHVCRFQWRSATERIVLRFDDLEFVRQTNWEDLVHISVEYDDEHTARWDIVSIVFVRDGWVSLDVHRLASTSTARKMDRKDEEVTLYMRNHQCS